MFLTILISVLLAIYSYFLTKKCLKQKKIIDYYRHLEIPRLQKNIAELVRKKFNLTDNDNS